MNLDFSVLALTVLVQEIFTAVKQLFIPIRIQFNIFWPPQLCDGVT